MLLCLRQKYCELQATGSNSEVSSGPQPEFPGVWMAQFVPTLSRELYYFSPAFFSLNFLSKVCPQKKNRTMQ